MSSSSIEVMGGEDMQMMLLGERASTSQMEVEEDPSQFPDDEENREAEEDLDEMNAPPGSIIFSPQDNTTFASNQRSKVKKKFHKSRKAVALTVKMEEGIDYSKINLPVACEICGKLMANGRILVQHMTTHSINKAFQCPHCPKSFARMVHLQGHLVFHGIQKQFECPICHQRFSRQDCVRVHMRLHDKSKCIFCSVCHKAFLTSGALNIHMRIHRGEKPFKCHLCGKCFTQKNHVITHIKRHTNVSETPFLKKLGPRMFQCEHCPRAFIRLSDYERHVQWNHGAVSGTNIISKVPAEVLGLKDESFGVVTHLDDLLIPNDVTLDHKIRKRFSGQSSFRRTMCSIGTQTEGDGGHVIIPRKYQKSISEGTQMSAPGTPRHEEEMYENDIYDEGMDRNYSSDEDEITYISDGTGPDIVPVSSSSTHEVGTKANDEAFDAVLRKNTTESEGTEQVTNESDVIEQISKEVDVTEQLTKENSLSLEISEPLSKPEQDEIRKKSSLSETAAPVPKETHSGHIKVENIKPVEKGPSIKASLFKSMKPIPVQTINQEDLDDIAEHDPMIREIPSKNTVRTSSVHTKMGPPTKILDVFNTKNWRGRGRGRGRGRPRNKGIIGLTGATHLRLIRRTMMNFITEKTEQLNESIRNGEEIPVKKSAKRVPKSKPHSEDFVCSSKTCEMCNSNVGKSEALEKRTKADSNSDTDPDEPKEHSAKLLQFLVSGEVKNLKGTHFRVLNDSKIGKPPSKADLEMAMDVSLENPNITISSASSQEVINNLRERAEFFSASAVTDDEFASPPVELQSFCIPTYSCKLCGREFRFEGKLHRHIEAVHQKKEIFSPDVKPGRGSSRYNHETEIVLANPSNNSLPIVEIGEIVPVVKEPQQQNPEIEALRSEWDDDDGENEIFIPEHKPALPPIRTVVKAQRQPLAMGRSKIVPIMERKIGRTTNIGTTSTFSDIYLSGVKLNINRLSGLAEFEQIQGVSSSGHVRSSKVLESVVNIAPPQPPTPIIKESTTDSLDTKCQKLLLKLFDHTLMVDCGLYQEHVSVILGKVLQHYGVKMIEDYGQGQYEVLKYNLWRLIEWKVTLEQMEEFYTEGKSVEEMMDDIMNGRVPIIAHHEMLENVADEQQVEQVQENNSVETLQISENQLVLSQVANALGGQINLGDGVTQVVLAQDVSPEMLQGAHIVTIDPTTGQVISQVTADQVILTNELGQQIQTIGGQVVVSQPSGVVGTLPPGSIVTTNITDSNN